MSHTGTWHQTERHDRWKRVTAGSLVEALGGTQLIAAKMCPDQSRAFKKVIAPFNQGFP